MARLNDRTGKQEEVPRPSIPIEVGRVDTEAIVAEKERFWSGKLKKPTQAKEPPVQGPRIQPDDQLASWYPALTAFVSDVTYDDGSRRTPGSVVVFVQDGMFTLCLTDKTGDPHRVAFQAAKTLSGAFSLAEMGLRAGDLPWRLPKASRQR